MTRFLILCAIYWQSAMHGVDPRIVTAMCYVESSFRPAVVNHGCYGLMQVNYQVWRKALSLDLYKLRGVDYNLHAGISILMEYYRQTGSIDKALHRYNCGYKYHSNYVQKVKKAMKKLYGREAWVTF
jgi:soluble lytic murein transglycosylase-like protein